MSYKVRADHVKFATVNGAKMAITTSIAPRFGRYASLGPRVSPTPTAAAISAFSDLMTKDYSDQAGAETVGPFDQAEVWRQGQRLMQQTYEAALSSGLQEGQAMAAAIYNVWQSSIPGKIPVTVLAAGEGRTELASFLEKLEGWFEDVQNLYLWKEENRSTQAETARTWIERAIYRQKAKNNGTRAYEAGLIQNHIGGYRGLEG